MEKAYGVNKDIKEFYYDFFEKQVKGGVKEIYFGPGR